MANAKGDSGESSVSSRSSGSGGRVIPLPQRSPARTPPASPRAADKSRTSGGFVDARGDVARPSGSAVSRPPARDSAGGAAPQRFGWKAAFTLLRDAGARWSDDACYRLASSLAYAALFSIFPLVLLAVTAVGYVLGNDATAHQRVVDSLAGATSPAFRTLLDQTLESLQSHRTARGIGAAVGVVTLVVGASGVFAELQSSLNLIWRVKPPPSAGVWSTVLEAAKAKAFSFGVVVVAAVAMLVLLAASTALAAMSDRADAIPGGKVLWTLVEMGTSIAALTLLLSAVYRLVPQTDVRWKDVLAGALLAAVLFTLLKNALAWYLGHLGTYAAYGAVGGVLGLLTWIYVASMIIFFGAEVGRVYAERYGSLRATPA